MCEDVWRHWTWEKETAGLKLVSNKGEGAGQHSFVSCGLLQAVDFSI